jgi:DNA primase
MTIQKHETNTWSDVHRLSLGGLSANALDQYLQDHPGIRQITLCLDNDEPGLTAARELSTELIAKGFIVKSELPPQGKDYNEYLCKYYDPERVRNSSIKHKSQKEER